jgi:hypothetical protein
MVIDWKIIPFSDELKNRFHEKGWRSWARRYPMLFDAIDRQKGELQAGTQRRR